MRVIFYEYLYAISKSKMLNGSFMRRKLVQEIVVLTRKELSWYRSESDLMQGKYLGKTKLPFVIRIARFEADIPAFYIEVSMT